MDLVPGLSKTDVALKNIQGKINEAENKLLKNEEVKPFTGLFSLFTVDEELPEECKQYG